MIKGGDIPKANLKTKDGGKTIQIDSSSSGILT